MIELEQMSKHVGGSDRSFGLVFAAVFAVIGLWPLLGDGDVRLWAIAMAVLLVIVAYLRPTALALPNRLWTRLGLLLGAIVAPIVMMVIYFVVITPFGLAWRVTGYDPLRLAINDDIESYWIPRTEPVGSMRNQY